MILEIKQRISNLETEMENCKVDVRKAAPEKYNSECYNVIESNNKILIQLNNFKGIHLIQFKKAFLFCPFITFKSELLTDSLYVSYILNEKSIMISNTNFIPITGLLIIEGITM
jgi:hypothetical protein